MGRRLWVLLAVTLMSVALVVIPAPVTARAYEPFPPRDWVDWNCTIHGSTFKLKDYEVSTNFAVGGRTTVPLLCGNSKTGWTHIIRSHGPGATESAWPNYRLFSNTNHPWETVMDIMTQVTLIDHNEGIYDTMNLGAVAARCYQTRWFLYDKASNIIYIKSTLVALLGDSTRVNTSYVIERGDGCIGTLVPGSRKYIKSSSTADASSSTDSAVRVTCGIADSGCFVHLSDNRSVYSSGSTGARVIKGSIKNRWAEMDWERSFLKYPTTHERCGYVRGGCFNHFQGGSIYYTPKYGSWPIGGAFRTAWANADYERSAFGYPISKESRPDGAPSNHRIQEFEYGFMYWDGTRVSGEAGTASCPNCRTTYKFPA